MKIPHPLRGIRDDKVRVCVGHKTCHPDELVRGDLPEVRRFCLTVEVIARSGSLERANAWISAFAEMTYMFKLLISLGAPPLVCLLSIKHLWKSVAISGRSGFETAGG